LYSKFSVNGDNIASFDVNNVVKIWNSKQPHGTLAAAQTKASILSLEWYPTHDSVVGSLHTPTVRIQMHLLDSLFLTPFHSKSLIILVSFLLMTMVFTGQIFSHYLS
jgi:WD40 repeat protein